MVKLLFLKYTMKRKKEYIISFDELVEIFYHKEHLSAKEGGEAKIWFDEFIDVIAKRNVDQFVDQSCNWAKEHLDWKHWLHGNQNHKSMRKVMICRFILAYWQSEMKRGFILNQNLKAKNLLIESICVALRDLIPFVQFKKREKHPWRSVNFSKVAGFSTTFVLILLSMITITIIFLRN